MATPAAYSGEPTAVRAEPNTLTAGPSSARAPNPSTNSDWIRITRQGSVWSQSEFCAESSSRWSVVPVSTWAPRISTGPLRFSATFFTAARICPGPRPFALSSVIPKEGTTPEDGLVGGLSPVHTRSQSAMRRSHSPIADSEQCSSRVWARLGSPGP
jgi:hypothetical protein